MAVFDATLFRAQFPAFKDATKYPDAQIEMYWDMASLFIAADECPYRTLSGKHLATALNMLTAHLMFLAGQTAGPSGGSSGGAASGGFTTSATVGEVSVAKLAPPATDGWQWWLAGSTYGQMLWALLDMLSVGGISIGGLPERDAFRKNAGVFW